MSSSKKRPMAESTPANEIRPTRPMNEAKLLKIDEDLLCLICTDLVKDARQVSCCGGLFCKGCIDDWMNQKPAGKQTCPGCRAALTKSKITVDLRSDRKSATQPRRCRYHEDHNCDFVGTRQEVDDHEAECDIDPDSCNNEDCADEKAALEAENAALKRTIQSLKQTASTAATTARRSLIAAALQSPEDILKNVYRFCGACIFHTDHRKKYTMTTTGGLTIEIREANYNVSLFFDYRPTEAKSARKVRVVATLVSFDPDNSADATADMTLYDNDNKSYGYPNWMTSANFEMYVKDGKFALGWTVTNVY